MFLVTDVLLLFIFQPQPQRRQGLLSQHQWKKTIIKFHPEGCVLLFVIFVFNILTNTVDRVYTQQFTVCLHYVITSQLTYYCIETAHHLLHETVCVISLSFGSCFQHVLFLLLFTSFVVVVMFYY